MLPKVRLLRFSKEACNTRDAAVLVALLLREWYGDAEESRECVGEEGQEGPGIGPRSTRRDAAGPAGERAGEV